MNIYCRMKALYDDKCLSENFICKWVQEFKDSVQELDDVLCTGQSQYDVAPDSTA